MTLSSKGKLHHFTTGQCVNEDDTNRIISIIEDGNKQYVICKLCNQYVNFQKKFAKEKKKLSDTIKKSILPLFEPGQKSVNKTSTNVKKTLKTQSEIQRNFDIACSRIFSYLVVVFPVFYLTETWHWNPRNSCL